MREIPRQEREGATIKLFDRTGATCRVFDFSALGFGHYLAESMARAFAVRFGPRTVETQSQAWRALRSLAQAIVDPGGEPLQKLPRNFLVRLRDSLARSGLGARGAQNQINISVALVEWCLRNEPRAIDSMAITLVPTLYERTQGVSRPAIAEEIVKKVLVACYEDINEVEYKLGQGRLLIERGVQPGDSEQLRAIHRLLKETDGMLPQQKIVRSRRLKKIAYEGGGLREIAEYLCLTIKQAFPFYLAILAQTGANPMALRLLTRDCVRPHSLVSSLERMVWDKSRSGREQYVDFPVSKHWSAPNLVRRLTALNADLVPLAHASEQQFLFIVNALMRRPASLITWASIHKHLDKFIAKHGLPIFDLAGFRSHVAKAHHIQGGSISAAQERLNHAEECTTSRYTPLADRASYHDQMVIGFQGRLIREARGEQPRWNKTAGGIKPAAHETIFGFRCSNPFEGRATGSVVGKLCLQFQKCATCPGALIPLDDVRVVGKILATFRHLEATGIRAKKEGWWDRYRAVYEPTYQILSKELLPAVSEVVRSKAEKYALLEILPYLE